jgi:hypothetical protein
LYESFNAEAERYAKIAEKTKPFLRIEFRRMP